MLVFHQLPHPLGERRKLLRGIQAIRLSVPRARLFLLLQPGHANFKKFVQVRTHDAEEFHALQQGVRGVQRLVKHPLVEFQPA